MTNSLTCNPIRRVAYGSSAAANQAGLCFYISVKSVWKRLERLHAQQPCLWIVILVSLPTENALWVVSWPVSHHQP